MRTSCYLSFPPSTSNASLVPTKPPQVSLVKNERCWRRQCVVVMGVASCCTIIGLEMCNSVALPHEAVVSEESVTVLIVEEVSNNSSLSNVGAKWSEKRTCPPWRGNSLETIVPENLPRPSARRRYESVRSTSKTAPPLSAPIKLQSNKGNCFSM
ncbi:uncharacterized protein LOC113866211 [Abrus precatorius]|uniref:Uncharacterized protein LOC113866211 n=1 Tax=Abrus precatorius TaxID=3816 RepID=A0A8B8LLR5_ABRPR|nr:uncharacterized protein LOC113866211 [Abrus precatorius]